MDDNLLLLPRPETSSASRTNTATHTSPLRCRMRSESLNSSLKMNLTKNRFACPLCLSSLLLLLVASYPAAIGSEPQAAVSPEVTAAMQPYLDGYQFAGFIAI